MGRPRNIACDISFPASVRPIGDVRNHSSKQMTRRSFFLGLISYGLLTGLIYRIVALIDRIGWVDAAVYVFSISVIVWVAIYIGVDLIAADDDDEPVGETGRSGGYNWTALVLDSLCAGMLAWRYYPDRLAGYHYRTASKHASWRTDSACHQLPYAMESGDFPLLIRTYFIGRRLDRRQAAQHH